MSILLMDNNRDRKLAISMALANAGLFVMHDNDENAEIFIATLASTKILIMLEENPAINWQDSRILNASQEFVIIKSKNIEVALPCLESIVLQATIDDSQLIQELVKKVQECAYRHIFPITNDTHMKGMVALAQKAAKCKASIMIEGETGTGKEIIAKYIHFHSAYAKGPFVAINCAAIPSSMIEAVLFGYEKGAFTNALNSYTGKFEQADHGTLFLDEIGEMSTDLQSKLLRVLQEQEIERIGSKQIQKIDVRVIAATNQDLKSQMTTGKFRMDLFYRLNVINLKISPLRKRLSDIPLLTSYFVNLYCQHLGQKAYSVTEDAMNLLCQHDWPGNVRELQNTIYRAVILDNDQLIDINDMSDLLEEKRLQVESTSLKNLEDEAIMQVLKETNGSRCDAAKKLMISPRTLRYKISKLKATGHVVP